MTAQAAPNQEVEDADPAPRAGQSLDSLLAPGEKVPWRGKPERWPFVFRTWPLSIFGAVLVASVIVFGVVTLTTEAPDFLACWSIPFLLAGLYMLVGHFFVTYREWTLTEYVIAESRVLIRHGIFRPSVTTYSLLGLPHTIVKMQGKDVGTILFKPREGEGYGPAPGYQTMWPYTPGYLLGLMFIRDPEGVREILERGRRGT